MKDRIDRLIDAYFEGTISPGQEKKLKAFLTSEEGAAKEYDDVRAVMGFFSVGRSLEATTRTVTLIPGWAKIAAVACSIALVAAAAGLLGRNDVDRVCITTCEGRTVTDEEIVMEDVETTLAELLSNCESVDEQLNEFFGE